jgi:hypothetical protein
VDGDELSSSADPSDGDTLDADSPGSDLVDDAIAGGAADTDADEAPATDTDQAPGGDSDEESPEWLDDDVDANDGTAVEPTEEEPMDEGRATGESTDEATAEETEVPDEEGTAASDSDASAAGTGSLAEALANDELDEEDPSEDDGFESPTWTTGDEHMENPNARDERNERTE